MRFSPFLLFVKVIWEKDLAVDSPVPWYTPLDASYFSLSSFRLTTIGRLFTKNMVLLWNTFILNLIYIHLYCKTSLPMHPIKLCHVDI